MSIKSATLAFSLVECLVALSLISIFIVMSNRVIVVSVKNYELAVHNIFISQQIDNLVEQIKYNLENKNQNKIILEWASSLKSYKRLKNIKMEQKGNKSWFELNFVNTYQNISFILDLH